MWFFPRYVTYGRKKNRATKSETVTTLDETRSTELKPLCDEECRITSEQRATKSPDSESASASCATSPYETTIFHFNRQNGDSEDETGIYETAGVSVSSFLPQPPSHRNNGKLQNAESAYSSFEEDQQEAGNYTDITVLSCNQNGDIVTHNIDSISKGLRHAKTTDGSKQIACSSPTKSHSVYQNHVIHAKHEPKQCVQNEQRKPVHTVYSPKRTSTSNQTDQSQARTESPLGCERNVLLVPEDGNQCSPSETTMHLIPEHKCLLHNVPPPPPPPTAVRLKNLERGINSWSSVHADVWYLRNICLLVSYLYYTYQKYYTFLIYVSHWNK